MALIGALLVTILLSTALGAIAIAGGIERRAAAAYRLSVELRAASEGALAVTIAELAAASWSAALAGSGSAYWRDPPPGVDVAGLTGEVRAESMMASAHGADTPVWQVFAQAEWRAVTGHPGRAGVLSWVADDWTERDGNPVQDANGMVLVRAVAVLGEARAWTEALCAKEGNGRLKVRHSRSW